MSIAFSKSPQGIPEGFGWSTIIPTREEGLPSWIKDCGLIYSEDGKHASIVVGCGMITGRVGHDILVFRGYDQNGAPLVDIIFKDTP